jgi:3-hydroxyacyl-CoA dehydrogenase
MLEEGAYPEDVDAALEAFGFAMGPFAVSDMSGLDIAWARRRRLAPARDPRERYVDIADLLCEQGRFGQKSGAGWYRYEPGSRRRMPDESVHRLIDQASAAKGIERRSIGDDEIVSRALSAMVNEAALVLEAGVAERASDIDLVMVHGYGFPAHEGGPVFWAQRQERDAILAAHDRLAQSTGHGFRAGDVAALLESAKEASDRWP